MQGASASPSLSVETCGAWRKSTFYPWIVSVGCVISDAVGGLVTDRGGACVMLAASVLLLGAFTTRVGAVPAVPVGSSFPLGFILLASGPLPGMFAMLPIKGCWGGRRVGRSREGRERG